jgi:hypothetical protein
MHYAIMMRVRVTVVCRVKTIIITYSECVFVALLIQLAKRRRRITLPSVASLSLRYFFKVPYKRHDFWGKNY